MVPADVAAPRMSFDNYVATEEGFDGGNVQLSVNGGPSPRSPRRPTPSTARPTWLTAADGNDNPLAGQPAFSGSDFGSVFGTWAVSQVDLSAAGVAPGDTVQLRLAAGRDSCTGNDGWYVDNIEILACAQPGGGGTSADADRHADATVATPTPATPTATPPAVKVATTIKVRKPADAPAYKADFKVRVKVLADALTPAGRVVIKYQGVTIAKGKLVDGKVKITIKKNLTVGKHKLVAKYQGSSTAKPSKKVFTIKIVE